MLKRSLCLALLLALMVASLGFSAAPVAAAPSRATSAPNADILPADTAFYFDFKIGDLNKTLDYLRATYKSVTDEEMPPIFAQVNLGLSELLKRDATFEKDVQNWLGDHISLAFRITKEQEDQIKKASDDGMKLDSMRDFRAQAVVAVAIKDDAAASKFLADVLANRKEDAQKLTERSVDVNGQKVTVYDQTTGCGKNCGSFALIKGYAILGTTDSVDEVLNSSKTNAPRLSSDANFNKIYSKLNPNSLVSMYVSPRLLNLVFMGIFGFQRAMSSMASVSAAMDATADASMPTLEPTADPATQMKQLMNLLRVFNGQAIGLVQNGKVWTVDIVQSIDVKAAQEAYTGLGLDPNLVQKIQGTKIEGKLAAQVPNDATAVVMSSGLGNLYQAFSAGMKMGSQFSGLARNNPKLGKLDMVPQFLEGGAKMAFDIDLAQELNDWANGEFAVYVRYNPDSVLAKMGREPFPFDITLLVDTSDAAKAKAFIEKINKGLEKTEKAKVESAGTDLYTVSGDKGFELGYGVVGNTLIISTGSGLQSAVNATKGDGVINALPVWKTAQQTAITPFTQYWFVNMNQLASAIKALAVSKMSDATADASSKKEQEMARFMKLIDLFDSFTISAGGVDAEGISMASVQLTQK